MQGSSAAPVRVPGHRSRAEPSLPSSLVLLLSCPQRLWVPVEATADGAGLVWVLER